MREGQNRKDSIIEHQDNVLKLFNESDNPDERNIKCVAAVLFAVLLTVLLTVLLVVLVAAVLAAPSAVLFAGLPGH